MIHLPESQISKEKFADIQRTIDGIVDEIPEKVFTTNLVHSYSPKGVAIAFCHNQTIKGLFGCQGNYSVGPGELQAQNSVPESSSHLQEIGGLFYVP